MKITLHHDKLTLAHLGQLPTWMIMAERVTQPVTETLNNLYVFGGWQPFNGFTLREDNALTYPGDPAMKPLATFTLEGVHAGETVCFYQSEWVAVIQADRSFEVCRMD